MGEEERKSRLAEAKSAYLRQNSKNLVDWYPWGPEAFEKAREENKLILLTVGAATCHSCHRMEKESYQNKEVAQLINQNYIPILVDKDERADLEAVYLLIVQCMTKRVGLPMTLLLTPEGAPFFAATYLPLQGYQNVPGTLDLFSSMYRAWQQEPETIRQTAEQIGTYVKNYASIQQTEKPGKQMLRRGRERLELIYDMVYGGFGPAPKFLMPHNSLFLMRYGAITEDPENFDMVKKTMLSAYQGGIYDHLGGGFMHYSTDPVWLIPSFEKLAGDNAMMALALAQTAKYTGQDVFYRVLRETLDFLCRDLRAENGAFYHGMDADADDGEDCEGSYYGWTADKIKEVLDFESEMFINYYNINEGTGRIENGMDIPNLVYQELDEKKINFLKKNRMALLEKRQERVRPLRDEKVLASDNGFVLGALAYAYRADGSEKYLEAAKKTADFVQKNLIRSDGRLIGCWYDAENYTLASALDYAAMIWGLTELQQATWDSDLFQVIVRLQDDFIRYFWDEEKKGFFAYANDGEALFLRPKRFYDAELPCENSVGAYNLMRLGRLCGRKDWYEKAGEILYGFGGEIMQNPTACSFWLYALCFWLSPGNEVYVFGDLSNPELNDMKEGLREYMMIEWNALHVPDEAKKKELEEILPSLTHFAPDFEKGEAYVGRGFEYAKKGVDEAESLAMGLSNYSYEPCL